MCDGRSWAPGHCCCCCSFPSSSWAFCYAAWDRETQAEVGMRAKLNADKSKKGKLKKGRKETACGISALFLFNRSSPVLAQLSFSLSPVWHGEQRAEPDLSAKVTRSESVYWNWPLWMSVNIVFRWIGSSPPQQSNCYRLSDSREQPCISLITLNIFVPFFFFIPRQGPGNRNVLKESFNFAQIIWREKNVTVS